MKIKTRLLLLLLPAIVITLGLLTGYSYLQASAQGARLADLEARNIAREHSSPIFNKLLQGEAVVTALAASLVEMSGAEEHSREGMSLVAKGVTASSKNFFGTWVLWAANAFDGKDAEYVGNEDFGNKEGRANAYWLWEGSSVIYDLSDDYDHELYYTVPQQKRRLMILPPYRDPDTKDNVLMTSIAKPLLRQGVFLGAVGVDIELDFIQGLIRNIRPYDSGYAMLISDTGAILGDPRDAPRSGADLSRVSDEVLQKMRGGEPFFLDETSVLDASSVRAFYMPVKLDSFDGPWFFMVALPMDKVLAESNRGLFIQLGISLVALLLLSALVIATASGVSRPLSRIAAYAHEVAAGNHQAQVDSRGFAVELLHLQSSLQSMLAVLLKGMQEVEERSRQASQQTERALAASIEAESAREASEAQRAAMQETARRLEVVAGNLRSTNQELSGKISVASRETQEQNNLMGETVVAISGMGDSVARVARNAGDAADFTRQTRERASQGAAIVDRTIDAFTGIRRETEALGSQIDELSKRTEDIGDILDMINDIADQTNLLALNAAIEAARAGEAGRGFAVVADEVRKLAEKTVQATRQVEQSVGGIRSSMRVSAEGIERTVKSVQDTVELGREAQSSLADIVTLVQAMSDQIQDIATLCREQNSTSEQVADIVDRLRQLSLVVSEAMDESAFMARTLEPEAKELALLVERLSGQ